MMANAQLGVFSLPQIQNEPLLHYAPHSKERGELHAALVQLQSQLPIEIPCIVNGEPVKTGKITEQRNPASHRTVVAKYHSATPGVVESAIKSALKAKEEWENMPWNDRAAIFLKAADLLSGKWRYKVMAATMLGQGKNAWQAEIDAAAELIDFLRFNVKYADDLYAIQPPMNAKGVWNRTEYRPLEGFIFAITPFNFTAIGGNLAAAPALLGNVVLWKPSPSAVLSNYFVYKVLEEAGLPKGVIQFIPAAQDQVEGVCDSIFAHRDFAGLHYTGSTAVFKKLWKDIANKVDVHRSYPRVVGETGGKDFHVYHPSADVKNGVINAVRGAFEYQGQKCSALSRAYVAKSLWEKKGFKKLLLEEVKKVKVGNPVEWGNFMGPVIHKGSFDKASKYLEIAKGDEYEIIAGGKGYTSPNIVLIVADDSEGYFVSPTVVVSKDPKSQLMTEEIFGPILTIYVYEDEEWTDIVNLVDESSDYALTGSIFATDRAAIVEATNALRYAAGNFYVNDKCTGAIVGAQPFGGGRGSGTNDKAGSINLLYRFVSPRSIKENFIDADNVLYPSNI